MLRKMLGWGGGDVAVTFLALAHILDATQDAGLGWGGFLRSLHLHTCGCYARCWVGVGDVNVPFSKNGRNVTAGTQVIDKKAGPF